PFPKPTQSKGFEDKAVLKSIHSPPAHTHTQKIHTSPTFLCPVHGGSEGSPDILRRLPQGETSSTTIIRFPPGTESAMKKTEDSNTLVLTVDAKANKHQVKQAVRKSSDIDVAKVNTLVRPGASLAPDYDAVDVANKIGII
ncbi:60S ribosomal protein L23a, partial [Myotis davidii]